LLSISKPRPTPTHRAELFLFEGTYLTHHRLTKAFFCYFSIFLKLFYRWSALKVFFIVLNKN